MIKAKLRQSKGETLVETLAALAIVVLAVFLLANMLTAAARLNNKSSNLLDSYQREVAITEGGESFLSDTDFSATNSDYSEFAAGAENVIKETPGTVQITWTETGIEKNASINVNFLGSKEGKLTSYSLVLASPAGNGGG